MTASRVGLLASAAAMAASCNAVLGLEELPRGSTGTAGSGTTGGDAGAAGDTSAGSGGFGGTSGTSGGGSSGSATGKGGASSAGGGAGSAASGRGGDAGQGEAGTGAGPTGPVCGDGVVDGDETCDDDGVEPGDGCDASCAPEDGWSCDGDDPSVCAEVCGDSLVVGLEAKAGGCDDGRKDDGDGCDASCRVEPGWFCSEEPSECADTCGNEVLDGAEGCDDGNADSADGCDACVVVSGWECDGEPSICADIDECDVGSDNCDENATCTNEDGGFTCACNVPAYAGDGVTCGDADECLDGSDNCDPNAACSNTTGGFTCACNAGFVGSGTSCSAIVTALGRGNLHMCAIIGAGSLRCWGSGTSGKLGYGSTDMIGDDETPASVGDVDVGAMVAQVEGGSNNTCALLTSGDVRCWGGSPEGQLGYGNTNSAGLNEPVASLGNVSLGGAATQVAVGTRHSCALLENGIVRCWGYNGTYGALGYGYTSNVGDNETPVQVAAVDVGGTVTQITAGATHTCALLETGSVRCWGEGGDGALGYGNFNDVGDNETPASVPVVSVGGTVKQIAAGADHTCAVLTTGKVRCWGGGFYGQLGYGNGNDIGDDEAPSTAGDVNVGGTVTQIAAGPYFTCALLTTGRVRCWGEANYGQLGHGNTTRIGDNETPASAGDVDVGDTVQQVVAGHDKTACALLTSGKVRCWGYTGALGYSGIAHIGDNETPASVGDVPLL